MNKKLLVLALVGAFSAPAMADVTINGTINMGPAFGTSGDASDVNTRNAVARGTLNDGSAVDAGKGFSTNGLVTGYSNVNLNSTEDLGNGNKVVFNAQLNFGGINEPGTAVTQRNTFLGFEGDWGSLRMGINEQIYERYMYQADNMDGAWGVAGNLNMLGTPGYGRFFEESNKACNPTQGCAGFYRRSGQSIWYDSPDINGFTFGIAQSLNAYQASANGTKPTITSLGAQYKPADLPFYVNVAMERHKDMFGLRAITNGGPGGATLGGIGAATTGSGSTDTAMQIGAGATLGDITAYIRYEQLKYKTDGLGTADVHEYKRNATWIGLRYALSTGTVNFNLGMAGDGTVACGTTFGAGCNANGSGATIITGGYFHNLSKQTQLMFLGSIVNNDNLASYPSVGSPSAGPGADLRTFAVTVKHAF